MKRFAWLTDIHLNFLPIDQLDAFLGRLAHERLDGLLIGGDIAEARSGRLPGADRPAAGNRRLFRAGQPRFLSRLDRPGPPAGPRLCASRPRLHYLSTAQAIELTGDVGLVGHDGWADARFGDYERSVVSMQDFRLIGDFRGLGKAARLPRLHALGDEAGDHIRRVLPPALERFSHVVLLTHVPPLRDACWHEGRTSDDDWAPFFTCRAVGDAILEIMPKYSRRQLTVLCGHTHGLESASRSRTSRF